MTQTRFDFTRPLPFRRQRHSTYARDGSNDDAVVLQTGEAWAVRMDGPGEVLHLWLSCQPGKPGTAYLRNLQILAWFDGSDTPQVNVPLGDLFAQGHDSLNPISTAAFDVSLSDTGNGDASPVAAFNFWLPMPFANGMRFEFRNNGDTPLELGCYLDIAQHADDSQIGPYRFHATYRVSDKEHGKPDDGMEMLNTTGEENYILLDVDNGEGAYLGSVLSVTSEPQHDGIWHEGDDMIFIDGMSWPPTLHGTGTEDYFNLAGGIHSGFKGLYHGISHHEPLGDPQRPYDGRYTLYRLHLADPIPFKHAIRATIEHGHGNNCNALYRSVAFWYGLGNGAVEVPLAHNEQAKFGNPGRV